jgi:uncharacterized SAM-binding protein YcdF (DUF218 family)
VTDAMKARGIRTVLSVTDGFHEYRAMAILSDHGFQPAASPSTTSPIKNSKAMPYFFKEAAEAALGRVVGYQLLSQWTSTVSQFHPHVNHG